MKVRNMFLALLAVGLSSGATRTAALSLPVYQVVQSGATGAQAAELSAALPMPPGLLPQTNGLLSFVDTNTYLRVPTLAVTDATVTNELAAVSKNPVPSMPLAFNAVDFNALSQMTALDTNVALNIASNALQSAGLYPTNAVPLAGKDWFMAFYTNDFGQVLSNSAALETRVAWRLTTPNGYPLVGPGAQIQVAFDPNGSVNRLLYSARQLRPGPIVDILPVATASNRFAAMFPANAQFTLQLVYWSPSLRPPPSPCPSCPAPEWNPTNILPWYEASGSVTRIDPATGGQETLSLRTQIIPATDDTRFVPRVSLNTVGSAPVSASATVSGGQPPYTYIWAASDPSASTNGGASMTYTARVRVAFPTLAVAFDPAAANVVVSWPAPSAGFVLESASDLRRPAWGPITNGVTTTNGQNTVVLPAIANQFFRLILSNSLPHVDALAVSVHDANGVSAQAVAQLAVVPQVVPAQLNGPVTYGCESPYDPGPATYQTCRVYWQTGMAQPGGGVEGFCWLEYNSWPGDFVAPSPHTILPANPWIYGDADYADWGVDTANIVLYNGDGDPDGRFIAEMDPDSPSNQYPVSYFHHPNGGAVEEDFQNYPPYAFYIKSDGTWGSIGKNRNLDWLCFYSCNTLTNIQSGSHPWARWGPAFNGLHLMTGFVTPAGDLAITFFDDFPTAMLLGWDKHPPLTIVAAWIDAAIADGAGTPAAMGPVGPVGVLDFLDCYWGKGPVGPSIPSSLIMGWWYVSSDLPVLFN